MSVCPPDFFAFMNVIVLVQIEGDAELERKQRIISMVSEMWHTSSLVSQLNIHIEEEVRSSYQEEGLDGQIYTIICQNLKGIPN